MYKSITISRRSYGLRNCTSCGHDDIQTSWTIWNYGFRRGAWHWAIGGWMWGGTDVQKSVRSIHASLDAGVNFIDTAPAYGLGHSERIVGDAIRGRRDKVILATKCGLVWHTTKGTFFVDQDGSHIHRYLGAESIRYEVRTELAAARDRLYRPLPDTLARPHDADRRDDGHASRLKKQGKIRAIGVSNCTPRSVAAIPFRGARGRCAGNSTACSIADWNTISALLRAKPHRGAGLLAAGQRAVDRQASIRPRLSGRRFAQP